MASKKKNVSTNLIGASQDEDLRLRVVALAAEMGIPFPQDYVENNMIQIVASTVDGKGEDSVASVYQYAADHYKPTPRPGQNTAAVTDDNIRYALEQLRVAQTPTK